MAGQLTGLPAAANGRSSAVRAVRLTDFAILGGQSLGGSSAYRLSVPAGPYVVAADMADSSGLYSGLSLPRTAKAGGVLTLDVAMAQVKQARRLQLAGAGSSARGYGKIVGISPDVRLSAPGFPRGLPYDDLLATSLSSNKRCAGGKMTLVEIKRRGDILQELELQRSDLVDPATRVTPHPLTAQYMVKGGGSVDASGRFAVDLRVVDVRSGKVVSKASASGPASELFDSADVLSAKLAADLCKKAKPKTKPKRPAAPPGSLTVAIKGHQAYLLSYRSSIETFCPDGSKGTATTTIRRERTIDFATPSPQAAALLEAAGKPAGVITKPIVIDAQVSESWSHVETFCGSSRTYDTPVCERSTIRMTGFLSPSPGGPGKLLLAAAGGEDRCRMDVGMGAAAAAVDLTKLRKPGTVTAAGRGVEDRTKPPSGGVLEDVERETFEWQITFRRY